jgi:hypothetical protein
MIGICAAVGGGPGVGGGQATILDYDDFDHDDVDWRDRLAGWVF